jgi:hypothetical protein
MISGENGLTAILPFLLVGTIRAVPAMIAFPIVA